MWGKVHRRSLLVSLLSNGKENLPTYTSPNRRDARGGGGKKVNPARGEENARVP